MSFVPTRVPAPPRRPGTVAVTLDGRCRRGRALDLRGLGLAPETLVRTVHEASTPGPTVSPPPRVRVDCDAAGLVHTHVGRIPPQTFDLHGALVAAARSRGVVVPAVRLLERARTELRETGGDAVAVDRRAAKRRVADAGSEERRLDERVASLRGRLDALREVGADASTVEAVEAELADTVGKLTEVETERIAAEQQLGQIERATRTDRDRRQRRLRLADRVGNLQRRVRRDLVERVYGDFAVAVEALPGDADPGSSPSAYAGDPTTAALAVASIARTDAPVVLTADRFGSPAEAATRLDAPVLRL
ncbi:hypothetical protein [Salinigranum sp. GCM10025319]|uniref:DUF7856 family protein n=1 Tax=Salinigranum sp. GCM10025319 TaxID=3252687 RepID=UPI003623BAB3